MKKFLVFTLTLILLLSALPFAGAAFKDQADVSFMTREAVEIMSDLKVVSGFPEGTFKPKDTLTRAQAAKILCCVALGTKAADALSATGSTFSDVPASHWANKFVEYCASKGIVAGVGSGKFSPDGKLTGYAFGKMLLVALGEDAAPFTGAEWDKNVKAKLHEKHLDYGITPSNKELSRQDACRLALNALFNGEADNAEGTLAYKSFGVMRTAAGYDKTHYYRPFTTYISNEEGTYWEGTEKKIVASPDYFVKSGAVKGGDVVKQLGVTDIEVEQLKVYRNAVSALWTSGDKNYLHEGNTSNYYLSGDGTRLEFYHAADTDTWTIIHLYYFPLKVKAVVEAAFYADGTVETPGAVVFENGWTVESNEFKESDAGNYALVYGHGKTTMNELVSAVEAFPGTVVQGVLTKLDKSGVTVGGKSYKFPARLGKAEEAKHYLDNGGALGDTVKVLLSDDNFAIMVWQ